VEPWGVGRGPLGVTVTDCEVAPCQAQSPPVERSLSKCSVVFGQRMVAPLRVADVTVAVGVGVGAISAGGA